MSNVHGFSPFQLVFGRNPRLPNVLTDRLLVLQSDSGSDLLSTNLKATQEARKAFIASESSKEIRRALRHNVRSSCAAKFFSGDSAYYKRNDNKRWGGSGKALGQDGQQILRKYGIIYVRCHPCHVSLKRDHTSDEENISQSRVEASCKEKERIIVL